MMLASNKGRWGEGGVGRESDNRDRRRQRRKKGRRANRLNRPCGNGGEKSKSLNKRCGGGAEKAGPKSSLWLIADGGEGGGQILLRATATCRSDELRGGRALETKEQQNARGRG